MKHVGWAQVLGVGAHGRFHQHRRPVPHSPCGGQKRPTGYTSYSPHPPVANAAYCWFTARRSARPASLLCLPCCATIQIWRMPVATRMGLWPRSALSMEASTPRSTASGRWCPAPSSTPSSPRATVIPSSTSPSSTTCPGSGTGSGRITVHRRASARARAAARRCLSAATATAKASSA
ncbi:hypothetical protein ZEAMMB73_Zm00001d006876 [Zea mays]|uniref:Uncharacterized protein n=1 Tax=Zea mays TaxID=4577 RepID=A0A1D6F1R0_MAIZE|nr:hypothetical protein ZEAMMB73_Zm00001d006876 [Zea mays]ONM25376.1 hypothetical protein ZEAMMB73_Zm00001d006876 [Zea mays]ONM25377.1 hypothetical protein ZEAMMB73_Zm00001d006876 [Zea mays]